MGGLVALVAFNGQFVDDYSNPVRFAGHFAGEFSGGLGIHLSGQVNDPFFCAYVYVETAEALVGRKARFDVCRNRAVGDGFLCFSSSLLGTLYHFVGTAFEVGAGRIGGCAFVAAAESEQGGKQ